MSIPLQILGDFLYHPVKLEVRASIVHGLWPDTSAGSIHENELCWDAYFAYYSKECNAALTDEGKHLCARRHEDIVRIAQLLTSEPSRMLIESTLRQDLTRGRTLREENRMIDSSIVVAVRLLAMVNIGSLPTQISNRSALPWKDGSLSHSIQEYFESYQQHDDDDALLMTDFTARNFHRMAGMSVIWTDNLVDHLRLVEGGRKVCIFHHITFLRWMKHVKSPIFPEEFLEETLETLTLLFPSTDRRTRQWLEEEYRADPGRVDNKLVNAGSLKSNHRSRRLEHYRFWRDRLGALSEAYDEAIPSSKALLKALSDRKRGEGWLNSWVAIVAICFTLFFGLIQSIEGAIQVYKVYHPVAG